MKIVANDLVPVYESDQGEHVVDGRELHEFLEVGKDFSTWMKDRIQKLDYTEGEEYSPVSGKTSNVGGRPSTEYILKLDAAKEIAMMESNKQGGKVRKYFIEVEKRFKSQSIDTSLLSPEMQMFKQLWDGQAKEQIERAKLQNQLIEVAGQAQIAVAAVTTIKETIIQREDDWRASINKMFNTAVQNSVNKDFQAMRNETYRILEERAHCDLQTRLRNLVERLEKSGATKTQLLKTSKLDVIESDPKLKEIYTSIVKEMSIRSMSC